MSNLKRKIVLLKPYKSFKVGQIIWKSKESMTKLVNDGIAKWDTGEAPATAKGDAQKGGK